MQNIYKRMALAAALTGTVGVFQVAHAEDTMCEATYEEVAPIAMNMPYWEFDQSESGWRKLGDCHSESARLLGRFIKKQESELRGVRWHLAQALALDGENARAAAEALKSLNPDEATQHPTFSWNTYVQATVEFLRNDREAFDLQYEAHRKAAAQDAANKVNLDVLTGLSRCFGRPYKEAYGKCRSAP
ncbi:MAG: hypothetical protein CFE46_10305 [Burkholderiales bacterium PBB6]|nr:MAG: hypothetical protein CFE46_10305 [Burkholderiales bacterium PBB6]